MKHTLKSILVTLTAFGMIPIACAEEPKIDGPPQPVVEKAMPAAQDERQAPSTIARRQLPTRLFLIPTSSIQPRRLAHSKHGSPASKPQVLMSPCARKVRSPSLRQPTKPSQSLIAHRSRR